MSESKQGKSQNLSSRFIRGGGEGREEILDEEEDKGDPGGGASGGNRAQKQRSVDGLFELVPQAEVEGDVDDEDEDELTYNSQGKPMQRSRMPLDKR